MQSSFSFEDALAKVKALGDYQDPQMKKIKDQADMLGGKTRYTATGVANTHLVLTKAGVKLKEMLVLLPSVLNLAALSDVEPQQAATLLTGITGALAGSFSFQCAFVSQLKILTESPGTTVWF